jgi:hypothetical protein
MTTKTDKRIDEIRDRIDRLDARVQAASSEVQDSMKEQVEALRRQEASARAAVREEANDARADGAEEKLSLLESRLESAEHALNAELAEDKKDFTDAMHAHLAESKAFLERLKAKGATKAGRAREHAEATMRDLDATTHTVEERLHELHEVSGDRLREEKTSATRARAELDRKLDEAGQKLD